MNAPKAFPQYRLAIARSLEAKLVGLDEPRYQTFLEAVAFAELRLPSYLAVFTDSIPLIVLYRDVALLLELNKDKNRYYVADIAFGDDNSPDPGSTILDGKSSYWWTEVIVPLSMFDSLGVSNNPKSLGDQANVIASFNELIVELRTPLGIRTQIASIIEERGSLPRSTVLAATSVATADAPP